MAHGAQGPCSSSNKGPGGFPPNPFQRPVRRNPPNPIFSIPNLAPDSCDHAVWFKREAGWRPGGGRTRRRRRPDMREEEEENELIGGRLFSRRPSCTAENVRARPEGHYSGVHGNWRNRLQATSKYELESCSEQKRPRVIDVIVRQVNVLVTKAKKSSTDKTKWRISIRQFQDLSADDVDQRECSPEQQLLAMAVLKLVAMAVLICVHFHRSAAVSFSYSSFSSVDFREEDDARITATGRIELLGDESGGRARGRVVYRQPVQLWDGVTGEAASFTVTFNASITSLPGRSSGAVGHGMAFFLAPYMPDLPQESYDGCLGLFDETLVQPAQQNGTASLVPSANATGSARFVAVELDTHRDTWDPSGRHVGVDVNSVDSRGHHVVLPDASLVDAGVLSATVSYDSATTILDIALVVGATGATYRLAATVDLRSLLPEQVAVGFSAATGDILGSDHAVLSCSFRSTLTTRNYNTSTSSSKNATVLLHVGIAAAAVLVLLLVLTVGLLLRRASRRLPDNDKKDMLAGDEDDDSLDDEEFGSSTGPRPIPYAQLAASTGDFAEERKLGQGGSGSVYRGHMEELDDGRRDVAIKVFLRGASLEGRKEYRTEVTVISRLRHRNLVQLIGWCHGRRRLLLVYELVHNGSLDRYLYGSKEETLTWQFRYQIILGLASAVLYLHQEWDQCVVHGDIKPSNIMLDESFNAKLGDFGLSRLIDHGMSLQTMTAMAGTPGYLDPECVISGKASTESDVYSFGITLLEIACGRRPMAPPSADSKQVFRLLEWVWDLYGQGAALDAADERLGGAFDRWEMERVVAVGLWSAHPDPKMRPAIRQAAEALQSRKFRMPVLPPRMPVAVYLQPFGASTMEYGYGGDSNTTVGSSVTMQYSLTSQTTATQSSNSSAPAGDSSHQ